MPDHALGLIPARWLATIQSGDTVSIVPRAQFPAWVNFVVEARIEVWVEEVQVEPSLRRRLTESLHSFYKPFINKETREIRVVVVEPADDVDEPIQLTMRRTDLTDADRIQYEALSYCWGSEQNTVRVFPKSEDKAWSVKAPISANLSSAIRRIRQRGEARTFWIDQLCINQNDVEERSQQIALMAYIYACAKSVCVWLGELDEIVHTKMDMDRIQDIAAACRSSGIWKDAHKAIHKGRITLWHNDRIFLRPWFQRVWVLQEVWNAATAIRPEDSESTHRVTVLYGQESVPWWVIMQANACLFNGFRTRRNNTIPNLWMRLFKIPRTLHGASNVELSSRLDILTTVIRGLEFKATDARDRIFALLAFGRETFRVAELPPLIKPDYNKTQAQVYCDFSLWWIKEYQSLRILSAVHTLRNRTWVDLSGDHAFRSHNDWLESVEQPTWTFWSNGDSTWERGTLALTEHVAYRACGEHRLDTNLLETGQAFDFESISPRFVPAFKGIQTNSIQSIEPFSVSYLRSPEHAELVKAYMRVFDPAGTQGTWRNTGSALSEPEGTPSRETLMTLAQHLEYHSRNGMYPRGWLPCLGRCMLKTPDGKIGLCPSGARVDDLVVILYGGLVPYLLRPNVTPGFYGFVGECYLDGFMHGEAFSSGGNPLEEHVFKLI